MRHWSMAMVHGGARGIAALLLALQAAAGGAVALAHASDSLGGPATFESHHTAQCVMLHDAARCAQCQYDATRPLATAKRRGPLPSGVLRQLPARDHAGRSPTRLRLRAAPPRAPPAPLA
jgi:2-C-methyl-D-erythritol 4-phosphate cytidylyltransferase